MSRTGRQSAAILVVRATPTGRVWEDRLVDLRIEDHADPVREMRRILTLHRAYAHMNVGDLAVEHGDFTKAEAEYGAAEKLAPESAEMLFWHAITLASNGKADAAKPLLARAYAMDENWRTLVERLPQKLFTWIVLSLAAASAVKLIWFP